MLVEFIFFWTFVIGISALGGFGVGLAMRHLSASSAKWKELVLGLLLSATGVAVMFYAATGGLQFEEQAYGPALSDTIRVVAITAPVWIGTFLLARRIKR